MPHPLELGMAHESHISIVVVDNIHGRQCSMTKAATRKVPMKYRYFIFITTKWDMYWHVFEG